MNNFSDKEYQNLRRDTAEVRACITRYIGYIISAIGFSGALKFFLSDKMKSLESNFILLIITLLIVTLLFEVIWYKFESHNRFVGYMQILMQEVDAIPIKSKDGPVLSEKDIKDKVYIKEYQKYLDAKHKKGIKDFYGWEFAVSRLHSGYFSNKFDDTLEDSILQSVKNSKFIFTVSNQLYPFIKVSDKDISFFEEIIFPLYRHKKSKNLVFNLRDYIKFLYSSKTKIILDDYTIERRYVVNGWRYPKKITQIAFTIVLSLFTYIGFLVYEKYPFMELKRMFSADILDTEIVPFAYVGIALLFVVFWFNRYVKNLKELVYGKSSIDYYCWMFFVYRTQMLYNRGVIPVFFSRAFVRFFKSNLYKRVLDKNWPTLKKELPKKASKLLDKYSKKLSDNKDFDDDLRNIHRVIKMSFKDELERLQ